MVTQKFFKVFTPKIGEDFQFDEYFSRWVGSTTNSGLFLASFGCIGSWAGCSSPMKFGQSSPLSSAHYPCLLPCCASSQSQEWRRWCRTLVRCKKKQPVVTLGCFFPLPNMGVSLNGGTPKSSILMRFSIINHPFWGIYHYFWKHPYRWDLKVQAGDWPPGSSGGWAAASKIMPHPTSANRVLICAENLLHITLKHGGDHATRFIHVCCI